MAIEEQRNWGKERMEKREKLTYALMAASGGCIGYAMTQAKDLRPECEHWALVVALILWCTSFWCGYKKVAAEIDCLQQHGLIESNLKQSAEHIAANAQVHHDVLLGLGGRLDVASQSYLLQEKLQVQTLIAGVVFYGLWQVLMMFSRGV